MLNTPFDVVKTRIQNQAKGSVLKYNWTLPGVALVYREEGYVLLKLGGRGVFFWCLQGRRLSQSLEYHWDKVSKASSFLILRFVLDSGRSTRGSCQRFSDWDQAVVSCRVLLLDLQFEGVRVLFLGAKPTSN